MVTRIAAADVFFFIVSVWQLLFYAWKYAVTGLVVVGRRAIRYRGFGCAGGEEDWLEAHLLLFDL